MDKEKRFGKWIDNSMRPKIFFIGIAGPSGAGKTTVGTRIKKHSKKFEHIKLDDYLKSPVTFPKKGKFTNWEDPTNLNFKKLARHLKMLKNGERINSKFYLYVPKKKVFPLILRPRKFIVVEGFLLFTNKVVRDMLDLKIYLDIPAEITLKRRAARVGKKAYEISEYDRRVVIPEFNKHGLAQMCYADFIISGNRPIEMVEKEVRKIIKKFFPND